MAFHDAQFKKLYNVVKPFEFRDSGIGQFVCSLDRSKDHLYSESGNPWFVLHRQMQLFLQMMNAHKLTLESAVIRIDPDTGNLEAYRVTDDEMITLRLLGIL